MDSEIVSIIITSYGKPNGLKRAITSLLRQSYKNIEIIVVDDNNPNTEFRKNTEEIMNLFSDSRIIYIKHEKNENGAVARNTGIATAKGIYICFLDNDDFYLKNRIENAVNFLNKNNCYNCICCGVLIVSNGIPKYIHKIYNPDKFHETLINDTCLLGTGSNIFLKRKVFEEVKGFDESFNRFQDVEFMLRVSKNNKVGIINDIDIVKVNSGLHSLNFKKLKGATELFINKFNDDISQLNEEKRKEFFDSRYTNILRAAFDNGTNKDINHAQKLVETVRQISDCELKIKNTIESYRRKRKFKGMLLESRVFYFINFRLKKKKIKKLYNYLSVEKANEINSFLKNY